MSSMSLNDHYIYIERPLNNIKTDFFSFQVLHGPFDDGTMVKEVTDGRCTIPAIFSGEAIQNWKRYQPSQYLKTKWFLVE